MALLGVVWFKAGGMDVERLVQFLEANDLTGDVCRHLASDGLLLPWWSEQTVEKPACSCLAKREKVHLTKHCSLTLPEVMQRFHLNYRSRKTRESVAAYVMELCPLAKHYNYSNTLDKIEIVWGINYAAILKKLLQETDLTYTKAMHVFIVQH